MTSRGAYAIAHPFGCGARLRLYPYHRITLARATGAAVAVALCSLGHKLHSHLTRWLRPLLTAIPGAQSESSTMLDDATWTKGPVCLFWQADLRTRGGARRTPTHSKGVISGRPEIHATVDFGSTSCGTLRSSVLKDREPLTLSARARRRAPLLPQRPDWTGSTLVAALLRNTSPVTHDGHLLPRGKHSPLLLQQYIRQLVVGGSVS
eukprot:scaffold4766_cov390-Prasinococcus_capsulatus_cf.AAC.5